MSKYTPGPWEVVTTEDPNVIDNYMIKIGTRTVSFFPYTRHVHSVNGKKYGGFAIDEQHLADGHLMASAPDLLEACLSSCELCRMMGSAKECKHCVIGKALAKAEGK